MHTLPRKMDFYLVSLLPPSVQKVSHSCLAAYIKSIVLPYFLLSNIEPATSTSHKWHLWNGIFAGYLIVVSIILLCLATFYAYEAALLNWALFIQPWHKPEFSWRQSEHFGRNIEVIDYSSFRNQHNSEEIFTWCYHKPHLTRILCRCWSAKFNVP